MGPAAESTSAGEADRNVRSDTSSRNDVDTVSASVWSGGWAVDLGLGNAAAVVVGGTRGMGLATARCLAEEGARVAVIGRTEAGVAAAVDDLAGRGSPDAVGLVADVRDGARVASVFADLAGRAR